MNIPRYSAACRRDVGALLRRGGSLTAYRSNAAIGVGPREGSWAWRLEREIEARFKVKYAVAVNSGTAALHCALAGLGVQGMDVVTSPLTFSATAAAIILAGARPVFADVDPKTYCLSKETVKNAITTKTAAILQVHLFGGRLGDVQELKAFGVPVIEDSCQSVGTRNGEGFGGAIGLAGAYSFGSVKPVAAGEGGCLVTGSYEVAHQARLLANHSENFGSVFVGYNYRLNEVSACIAYHGLRKLKNNTPYLTPYLVKKRGPNDKPYLSKHLGHYPAFAKYMRGKLPVADDLCERSLCVR